MSVRQAGPPAGAAALAVVAVLVWRRLAHPRPPVPDRAGLPVTVRPGPGRNQITTGDVERWLAAMYEAGAGKLAPAYGLATAPPSDPPGDDYPGGLAPLEALGGYPRSGIGLPLGLLGLRHHTPIDPDTQPPPGHVGG